MIILYLIFDYIVPFLTISSILIDICFTNLIFIGAIFNSYNYWYLLSYSNQLTLHYSILFLIISIIIILFFFNVSLVFTRSYFNFILIFNDLYLCYYLESISWTLVFKFIHSLSYYFILVFNNINWVLINLISYSFFSNFSFFIPIYLDFILIFSIFFFKGPINSIEVFNGFNLCSSILFINFFSLFFQIQFIIFYILFYLIARIHSLLSLIILIEDLVN